MKHNRMIVLAFCLALPLHSSGALAQGAGVCNRQADDISGRVTADADAWINAIDPSLPQDEKDAFKLLFSRNRDKSFSRC